MELIVVVANETESGGETTSLLAPVCLEKALEVEAWSKGFVLDYCLKALDHRHRWSWFPLVSKDGKFGTKACIAKNFKQEIFGRLKDGHQTFSHDGRMPVKTRKAIQIMKEIGFKSHGNFNGHEKFSHALFEPYPPGVNPVNCWFNFMNRDTVDMNFMAKMLHRR